MSGASDFCLEAQGFRLREMLKLNHVRELTVCLPCTRHAGGVQDHSRQRGGC